jgi:hypothetical protein
MMNTREEMIEAFLENFVPPHQHDGARIALTLTVQTLERRAELKGGLCGGLTPRTASAPAGA